MNFRERILREVQAIQRDKTQKKKSYTLKEVMEQLEQYPSLPIRIRRFRSKLYRAKDNVVNLPFNMKAFIHRGRHGWNVKDNWSMDSALSRQLDAQFAEFITHFEGDDAFCGGPFGFAHPDATWDDYEKNPSYSDDDNREWIKMLKTIRKGFRDYWMHEENSYKITDMDKRLEADLAVQDGVKLSLELMGKNWGSFWW